MVCWPEKGARRRRMARVLVMLPDQSAASQGGGLKNEPKTRTSYHVIPASAHFLPGLNGPDSGTIPAATGGGMARLALRSVPPSEP